MKSNIVWGVVRGLWLATFFSLFVIGEYLLLGPAPFTKIGSSLHEVIAFYFVAGITAGALVGALRPLTRTRPGAIAVGILTALIVASEIIWTKSGSPSHWKGVDWFTVIVGAIIYGVMFSSEGLWNRE